MRELSFSIIAVFIALYSYSLPVDTTIARTVALNFMIAHRDSSVSIKNIHVEKNKGVNSYYIVNFKEGGWVIVASDNSVVPVLGYGLTGTFEMKSAKPEALTFLLNDYKEQIDTVVKSKQNHSEREEWKSLSKKSTLKSSNAYTPGRNLLNIPGRGEVKWGQDKNFNDDCSPSYNKYCPAAIGFDCYCDRNPVGCGAVAMGQIMWYWQWPQSSTYRTYNWGLMPNKLDYYSTTAQEDQIAFLLKDCGNASNMTYSCPGSWTTTENIEDAFKAKFIYKSAKKHKRSDWQYGNAWKDLVRSEIDAGRPLFYRGDKSDLSTEKHFFVVDGYDIIDSYYFHINWGWSGSYNGGHWYLDNLNLGGSNFNKNQMVITGVSPTREENIPPNVNIIDRSYSSVTSTKTELAQQYIILPLSGKSLVVESGASYTLIAGNTIKLNPGFVAKAGSSFKAVIDESLSYGEMDITVPSWYNAFTPNGDGVNDLLCINVTNANSWEFEAFDRSGSPIFQSAGTITDGKACVWDGTNAAINEGNACIFRFKNNFGRAVEKAYFVYAVAGLKSSVENQDTLVFAELADQDIETNIEIPDGKNTLSISPNPSNGTVTFSHQQSAIEAITIFDTMGKELQRISGIFQTEHTMKLDHLPKGVYVSETKLVDKSSIRNLIIIQ